MIVRVPLLPVEFEIVARRRTQPIRFGVRTLMIMVALAALAVYLLLPLSAADQRLMAAYEQLGRGDCFTKEPDLTKERVISMIGPPTRMEPIIPNHCHDYVWIAHFDTPLCYQEFELGLSIDPPTDLVAAVGLNKREYQGLELMLFRITQLMARIGF